MQHYLRTLLSLVGALALPFAAHGYGGPGSIISAIGAFFGLVVLVLVSLMAFLWYPLKRLTRRLLGRDRAREEDGGGDKEA
jgi:hypothetical protein